MINALRKIFSKEKESPIITINSNNTEKQNAEQLGGNYCSDVC